MIRVRVLGVGSPSGNDVIGWQVAQALRDDTRMLRFKPRMEVDIIALDRPGASLVRLLSGVDHVIIVDALCDGATAGSVRLLSRSQLAADDARISVHAFGVASAVALAEALGDGRAEIRLLGITIPASDGTGMDDAVAAAMPRALGMLVAELDRICSHAAC